MVHNGHRIIEPLEQIMLLKRAIAFSVPVHFDTERRNAKLIHGFSYCFDMSFFHVSC